MFLFSIRSHHILKDLVSCEKQENREQGDGNPRIGQVSLH
jgi:hypothetical protein